MRYALHLSACFMMLSVLAGAQCMGPDVGFNFGEPRIPKPGEFNEAAITDTDGDNIADADDNCPKVSNADQLDSDGDDTGDACEAPPASKPQVRVRTSMGNFVIELNDELAPLSVANFLQYVDEGFYTDTIFHRVDRSVNVIQGGGFTADFTKKKTHDPVVSESDNGLLNVRASVGLARTSDPDSGTSQFYVNTQDNPGFDPEQNPPGFTIFGMVISGMSVVDAIQAVPVESRGGHSDVPVDTITILSVDRL
jgi:cyclophilin family peptidyl-prolyl cis-trans isomerase